MANLGIGETGEALRRSTVEVRCGRASSGSGVLWRKDGLIVTNAHVARAAEVTIALWDGRTFRGRTVTRDAGRDLASVRVEASGLIAARTGDASALRAGELVLAVGNPLGFTGALSTGVVHAVGPLRGLGTQRFVQATLRLAPGNSGGPLANAAGEVVGINTMIVSGGLALAIPVNTVQQFLAGKPAPKIGVTVQPVAQGLMVLGVEEGSPAQRSSLLIGDVILDMEEQAGVMRVRFQRGGVPKAREVAVRLQ